MWVIDTECFSNFWILCAKNINTNDKLLFDNDQVFKLFNTVFFEPYAKMTIKDFMRSEKTIGFNSLKYDLPMIAAVIQSSTHERLKVISDELILSGKPHWEVCKRFGINLTDLYKNHIDLIEVAPGKASLKLYGGRLNAKTLRDLPYEPDTILTRAQMIEVGNYCFNDLDLTEELFKALGPQLKLRNEMSKKYGINLRSKSDAQIAEAIIKKQVEILAQREIKKPVFNKKAVKYDAPEIIQFESEPLKNLLQKIKETEFNISEKGSIELPLWMTKEKISIGEMSYKLGIGGLHSCESKRTILIDSGFILRDADVSSYYPSIIINQNLAPSSMGHYFMQVYKNLVKERLEAKQTGNKTANDTLKLTINGSFGKFGNRYSSLYSPKLLLQTTITGQLLLLMLIESLESSGIKVVSANTDGVVMYFQKCHCELVARNTRQWEQKTGLSLEFTDYDLLASRDVNSYIALKIDGSIKSKGIFTHTTLSKNPTGSIVYKAVTDFVVNNISLEKTIRECRKITEFLTVRTVRGGAVWNNEYLGKVVRFYKSSAISSDQQISYKKNGNKVPKSNGVRPCMTLPDTFPDDIDYDYYIKEAQKVLKEIGYG